MNTDLVSAGFAHVDLRNVPKTFDGGDVRTDDNGPTSWYGERMCCLGCREFEKSENPLPEVLEPGLPMGMGLTSTYMLAVLDCAECGEVFAEFWQ